MVRGDRRSRLLAELAAGGLAVALVPACGSDGPGHVDAPEAGPTPGSDGASVERNASPEIRRVRLEPSQLLPGERVGAIVDAWDPDGDELRLGFTWTVGGRPVPGGARELIVPDDARKGDAVEVSVVASDGRATTAPARARARVRNRPPEWRSLHLDPGAEVDPGSAVRVVADAEDADGDPVEIAITWLVNGTAVSQGTPSLSTEGLRRGDRIQARVAISDGEHRGPTRETGVVRVGNSPPRIVSAPGSFAADGTFRYTVEVQDPDGDRNFRFELAEGPPGMEIDGVLGELIWEADASLLGSHLVEIVASDPDGATARQRFELVVSEGDTPQPPQPPADSTP